MSLTRVWNITDGGQQDVKSHNRMVLGESLKPGRYVQVDEASLEGATKLHADVDAKMLHIGKRPPEWYLKLKKPPRAVVDARVVTDKGELVGKKVAVAKGHKRAAKAPETTEAPVEAPAAPVETGSGETLVEEATEEATGEASSEETRSYGGRRRRRK